MDGDRLTATGHPFRSHHDGEHLDQVAQHLETGRSRSDDDRSSQFGDGRGPARQDPPHLVPAVEVPGQVRIVIVSQPAEVHDSPRSTTLRSPSHARGCGSVEHFEVLRAGHRVDQVAHDVDVLEGCVDRALLRDVAVRRCRCLRARGHRPAWPGLARCNGRCGRHRAVRERDVHRRSRSIPRRAPSTWEDDPRRSELAGRREGQSEHDGDEEEKPERSHARLFERGLRMDASGSGRQRVAAAMAVTHLSQRSDAPPGPQASSRPSVMWTVRSA